MSNFLFEVFESLAKPIGGLIKKGFLCFKNRDKFFVKDFQKQKEKEYYYCKKLNSNEHGVFHRKNKNNNLVRIYKKPEHDNPRKLARQYAKKLAMKQAGII